MHTLKTIKECVREKEVLKIGVSYLICVPRTESCHVNGFLGLLHRWNKKPHPFLGVVAHLPRCLVAPVELALLTCGTGFHLR
jgi:hypothetical protein